VLSILSKINSPF